MTKRIGVLLISAECEHLRVESGLDFLAQTQTLLTDLRGRRTGCGWRIPIPIAHGSVSVSGNPVYQDLGYCIAMLEISVRLDLEDGPPDPLDILGDLVISDGQSTITLETTFVDVWLVALIEALPRLQSLEHVVVEAEEPIPLRVDVDSEGSLLISDGQGAVVARSISELKSAIRDAAGALLNAMRAIPNTESNPDLAKIGQFYRSPAK